MRYSTSSTTTTTATTAGSSSSNTRSSSSSTSSYLECIPSLTKSFTATQFLPSLDKSLASLMAGTKKTLSNHKKKGQPHLSSSNTSLGTGCSQIGRDKKFLCKVQSKEQSPHISEGEGGVGIGCKSLSKLESKKASMSHTSNKVSKCPDLGVESKVTQRIFRQLRAALIGKGVPLKIKNVPLNFELTLFRKSSISQPIQSSKTFADVPFFLPLLIPGSPPFFLSTNV